MAICSKPSCSRPAAVLLGYDYDARRALLADPPEGRPSPHAYLLCSGCADRLKTPNGWELVDERDRPPLFTAVRERMVGGSAEASSPASYGFGA